MAGVEAMRRGHHVDEFGFDFTYPMLASARRHRDVVGGIHQGLIDPSPRSAATPAFAAAGACLIRPA
ncbi:MAG: hypothetical protein ACYC1E_17720 [Propionibacteriaceae bacterium]